MHEAMTSLRENNETETFKCENSDKEFKNNKINSVHNSQKDHKCDSCGKPFSIAQYLKIK